MQTLFDQATALANGTITSEELVHEALARVADPHGEGRRVFLKVYRDQALDQARAQDRLRGQGARSSLMAGLPVSIKDLFDVATEVTTAGSTVLAGAAPAKEDAVVVQRLRAAGAVIMGRTNMSEFAFSALGLNPHYGTPKNPFDRCTGRLPGGSSSGAAVSVSDGMATIGIGTDTGGSVRIPAALCGLAGFKPTQRRISRRGVLPLSKTFDSVGPIAPSIICCAIVNSVLAGMDHRLPVQQELSGLRFGLLKYAMEDLDDHVAKSFQRTLSILSRRGCRFVELAFDELDGLADYFSKGGVASAEAFAWHNRLLASQKSQYDPHIARRILQGKGISAVEFIAMLEYRRRLVDRSAELLGRCDSLIMPTVPVIAPAIDAIQGDRDKWSRINALLFRNTVIANLIDGCSVTIPCQRNGEPPVGLMLINGSNADKTTLSVGASIEQTFRSARR